MPNLIKSIALYLPQYHPIPENDLWWGKGFTEWTNVVQSIPKFRGHYQPHLPSDLGFYDLRLLETMIAQAEMARQYAIDGFCYYHYWFNGKLLLERPLEQMLLSGKPDFPFCLCWANENWTRKWDGFDQEILIQQNYSEEDDRAHIKYLIPFFKDSRYIKIEGKPVFLMYRTELHPNINKAVEIWKEEAKLEGIEDLYLIRVENFKRNFNPNIHEFDAGLEFSPDLTCSGKKISKNNLLKHLLLKLLHQCNISKNALFTNKVYSYSEMVEKTLNRNLPTYKYFRCISPSWDNSARRKTNATIYHQSTPHKFKYWTGQVLDQVSKNMDASEQLIFINAWNEWAEGCHLEPDQKNGPAYLEAFQEAMQRFNIIDNKKR